MAAWPRAFLYQKGLLGVAVVALCALGGAIVDDTLSFIPDVSVGCNLEITSGSVQRFLSWLCGSVISYVEQEYHRARSGQVCVGDMVKMLAICGLIQACRQWKRDQSASPQESGATTRLQKAVEKSVDGTTRSNRNFISNVSATADANKTDPGLLRKYSTLKSYSTVFATYPSIRTFYRGHPQADKLPNEPTPLPLLVFIHGLGGSLAQFYPLLESLVNVAPCLGIDLPGCGLSHFSPTKWESYSIEALAELISVVIDQHYSQGSKQGVVLIGHSMGCSLSTLVASKVWPIQEKTSFDVLGVIAVCPRASPLPQAQVVKLRRFLHLPTPVFDLWRKWDRMGGPQSASVARFVGPNAVIETKKLQERFNAQSRTSVWRRMAWGSLPTINNDGMMVGGLPGLDVWAGLDVPVFLVAGEADHITKAEEVSFIRETLTNRENLDFKLSPDASGVLPKAAAAELTSDGEKCGLAISDTETTLIEPNGQSKSEQNTSERPFLLRPRPYLKTSVLPSPASHALLYDFATYRTLAGLIQTFLAEHVDDRLSLGWQLRHLSTEGKWDVKNLAKWQAVRPISNPIAGIFRALKTLREADDRHSPTIFVDEWRKKIMAVIDISHDNPVYDPKGLDGSIEYHKIPTVSKIPPTIKEVRDFVSLVDRLRAQSISACDNTRLIGVHCHYGFNRTGFFICSYLIEKENFSVQQAIDEFEAQRPPGIRHEHFIDTLFVRYCVGLKRAPAP